MIHCQIVLVRTSMIQTYKRKMTCNKPRTNQESERKKKRLMYPGVFSSGVQIIEEFANDIEIHLTSKTRIVIKCLFNVKGFLYISRLSHIHLFNLLLHSIAVSWRTRRASFCFLLLFVLLLSFSEPPLLFLRSDSHMLRKLAKILSPSREFDLQNMHEKLDFGQWSFLPAQRMMDFRL